MIIVRAINDKTALFKTKFANLSFQMITRAILSLIEYLGVIALPGSAITKRN